MIQISGKNTAGEGRVKPVKQFSFFVFLAAVIALSSSFGHAGEAHYRWTDQWGNPVHSDRPPPKGIDYEVVESGTSLVRRVNSAEGVVPAEVEPSIDNQFQQIDTGKVETVEKNPEYCKRAQDNLHALSTSARIRMRDEDGEPYLMGQEEKEAMMKDAQDVIDMHCD